jgi:trimethylamine:corrinoid methyltransferase-like protein
MVEPGTQRVRADRARSRSDHDRTIVTDAHAATLNTDWSSQATDGVRPAASAPNSFDLDGGRRSYNHADYQNFICLGHMLNVSAFFSGWPLSSPSTRTRRSATSTRSTTR